MRWLEKFKKKGDKKGLDCVFSNKSIEQYIKITTKRGYAL